MADDNSHIRSRVREECLTLTPEDGDFDAGVLEERLEKMLALVKKVPRTVAEIQSAADRTRESSGTRVFNIYELAESILEHLALKDLVQARNICKETRAVVRTSPHIMRRHAALNVECNDDQDDTTVIKQHLDFDLTVATGSVGYDGSYYHLIGQRPWSSYDPNNPYRFHLEFHRSLKLELTWEVCNYYQDGWCGNEGDIWHKRTVIIPARYGETDSLWRYLRVATPVDNWAPKKEYDEVDIVLRSQCFEGHPVVEMKVFSGTVTLGEVYEWLHDRILERSTVELCSYAWGDDGQLILEHRIEY